MVTKRIDTQLNILEYVGYLQADTEQGKTDVRDALMKLWGFVESAHGVTPLSELETERARIERRKRRI